MNITETMALIEALKTEETVKGIDNSLYIDFYEKMYLKQLSMYKSNLNRQMGKMFSHDEQLLIDRLIRIG